MKIGIIGLGLIGGSLGRAIIKKTEHTVYAMDISEDVMLKASLLNAYHEVLSDDNIGKVDILIIALYPRITIEYIKKYAPKLKKGAIITDCSGIKRNVVDAMRKVSVKYPDIAFIGGHPMAGREYIGINHSTAGLFEKASMILVPVSADIDARMTLKTIFYEIGFGTVVSTKAKNHDEMIAYTSQLAHIISSSYVKSPAAVKHYGYSAGSFRDLTRVAKLNPEMWAELMMDNKDCLIEEIQILEKHLSEYRKALESVDESKLKILLKEGNDLKENIEKELRKRNTEK